MKRIFLHAGIIVVIIILNGCAAPSPAKNEAGLFVPDDLEATLWAESPMIYNPTNMDVDS